MPGASSGHNRATEIAPEFATHHLPTVVREQLFPREQSVEIASLLSIAGGSLERFIPATRVDSLLLLEQIERVAGDLYAAFAFQNQVEEIAPRELLTAFVGDTRLSDSLEKAKQLLEFQQLSVTAGGLLANPAWLYSALEKLGAPRIAVCGLNHRDLHGGNILLDHTHRGAPEDRPYYIIDFDESEWGFFGYDLAYLECERFIKTSAGISPGTAAGILGADASRLVTLDPLPEGIAPFAQFRSALLQAESKAQHAGPREDEMRHQSLVARIAAGMTWLRRASVTSNQALAATYYSAVHAAQYLNTYLPQAFEGLTDLRPGHATHTSSPPAIADSHASGQDTLPAGLPTSFDPAVDALLQRLDGLSSPNRHYILVAERLETDESFQAIGLVPWSCAIDLDPASSEDGLLRRVEGNLSGSRGLHLFSTAIPVVNYRNGTAWMLATSP